MGIQPPPTTRTYRSNLMLFRTGRSNLIVVSNGPFDSHCCLERVVRLAGEGGRRSHQGPSRVPSPPPRQPNHPLGLPPATGPPKHNQASGSDGSNGPFAFILVVSGGPVESVGGCLPLRTRRSNLFVLPNSPCGSRMGGLPKIRPGRSHLGWGGAPPPRPNHPKHNQANLVTKSDRSR